MPADRIHVVSAAIVRDGRILLAQRAPETSFPWAWCTPGGKVEPGERPLDALLRELREEIGVELADGIEPQTVFNVHIDPPVARHPLRITCYRIEWKHVAWVPMPGDGTTGIGWFSDRDLGRLQLAPADSAGRQHLIRALATSGDIGSPWNTCAKCMNFIDADDVHDGSEVRCLGCRLWHVVVELDGGGWALDPIDEPNREDASAPEATS